MKQLDDLYYKTFNIPPIKDKDYLNRQIIEQLFKKPKNDNRVNTPHTQVPYPNIVQQADLLYLPHDGAYKYALVVVDLGSRKTDAEPLKDKTSEAVLKGFQNIYSRDILKIPKRMEIDGGNEFKGKCTRFFQVNDVDVLFNKPYRHRQTAVVERRNQIIGDIIFKRQYAQELLTGKPSTEWVTDLPIIIYALNKHYKPIKAKKSDEPLFTKSTSNVLLEGMKVRAVLDAPRDLVSGKKLSGRFRSADLRFDPKIRTIEQVIIRPNYPILYRLNDDPRTVYTYNQLRVVHPSEQLPPHTVIRQPYKDIDNDKPISNENKKIVQVKTRTRTVKRNKLFDDYYI